jgi:hypothetical protein
MNSAMTKAAAPMIGGMIWPPVEATASTPAAKCGAKPERFISGMVIGPSTMTLATALPEMVPNKLDENTDTLPGPPAAAPVSAMAKSMNNCPVPVRSMKAPNSTKIST